MWQYRYPDELYHFSLFKRKSTANKTKSNGDWKNHKYYTKVTLPNNKVRYFYSRLEYLAYQASQKAQSLSNKIVDNVKSKANKVVSDSKSIKTDISNNIKLAKNIVDNNRDKTASQINAKLTTPTKKLISSTIKKVLSSTVFKASLTIADAVATAVSNKKYLDKKDITPTKIETSEKDSNEELMHKINPNYNSDWQKTWNNIDDGYANNCANCALTFDLAKRGVEVQTAPWSLDGMTKQEILDCYIGEEIHEAGYGPNVDPEHMAQKNNEIWDKIAKEQGDGARGYLMMYWRDGGGHAVNYVIEDGHAYIIDSQVDQKLEMNDYLLYASEYSFFRTDNIYVDSYRVDQYINKGSKKR